MRNSKAAPERERIAVFRSGKKKESLAAWRYWEIVGALQWLGADRLTAYDAEARICRALDFFSHMLLLYTITAVPSARTDSTKQEPLPNTFSILSVGKLSAKQILNLLKT